MVKIKFIPFSYSHFHTTFLHPLINDVLINIAKKCSISLDWLCSVSLAQLTLSSLGNLADFLYALVETESIKLDIDVHDHLPNDLESENDKWYTSITIYGNDCKHENNADLCKIICKVKNNHFDLETFAISEKMYDLAKKRQEIIIQRYL